MLEFLSRAVAEDRVKMAGMKNTGKSREALSTSVSQTDGAVGDAGTSVQHSPHWLTSDWEESPLFTFCFPFSAYTSIGFFPLLFCEIKGAITTLVHN